MAVAKYGATNSIITEADENKYFSISIPRQWYPGGGDGIIDKSVKLLKLRYGKIIELTFKEVEKKGNRIRKKTLHKI